MAEKNKPHPKGSELAPSIDKIDKRLNMLDQRLDNIDSVVSALVERVMNQLIAIGITCPHCGRSMEFNLIGNRKPGVARE